MSAGTWDALVARGSGLCTGEGRGAPRGGRSFEWDTKGSFRSAPRASAALSASSTGGDEASLEVPSTASLSGDAAGADVADTDVADTDAADADVAGGP